LCLTFDRRLMYWDKRQRAARQLSDRLPRGNLLWREPGPLWKTMSTAVVGRLSLGDLSLVHIDRDSGACLSYSLVLRRAHPRSVAAHAGALFVIFAEHIDVYSLGDGQFIVSQSLPPKMIWLRDRFFAGPEGWYALSFNGMTAQFEQVCDAATREELQLI